MHADEVDINVGLVERLLAEQFPQWSDLPVTRVRSTGTVNAIFRVGDDYCARLPRKESWSKDLEDECHWLPKLASSLSLRVPEPVAPGTPGSGYPFSWAIYRWIDGTPYADELVDDEERAATDLARFVAELRRIDSSGAPKGGRRPLRELDAETRTAIDNASDEIDSVATTAAWELAVQTPSWAGTPVWIHADLLRPNLLVHAGRLHAVIDFGALGVGDPAADVIAAWSVFGSAGRQVFRTALDVDDGTWDRARGIALHQAAMIIPYYRETNPDFAAYAKRTIEEILIDLNA
jgi:aminoglycoside phosphotransferase (APT) family kinase protein